MTEHVVKIVVQGHLSNALVSALDGFAVDTSESGVSSLTGTVTDQAMLFGVLEIFDGLNIEVLSVNRVDGRDEKTHTTS